LGVEGFLPLVCGLLQSNLFADLLFFRGHQVPSIGSPSTDEDFQSEGELDAHYGLAGPVAVAQEWMRLVLEESDLLSAWRLTDPDFRLAMTQALRWANRNHPYLAGLDAKTAAEKLAQEADSHPLWEHFQATQLSEMQEAWADFDLDTWGAASLGRWPIHWPTGRGEPY
jgi:hypothetical protein